MVKGPGSESVNRQLWKTFFLIFNLQAIKKKKHLEVSPIKPLVAVMD